MTLRHTISKAMIAAAIIMHHRLHLLVASRNRCDKIYLDHGEARILNVNRIRTAMVSQFRLHYKVALISSLD